MNKSYTVSSSVYTADPELKDGQIVVTVKNESIKIDLTERSTRGTDPIIEYFARGYYCSDLDQDAISCLIDNIHTYNILFVDDFHITVYRLRAINRFNLVIREEVIRVINFHHSKLKGLITFNEGITLPGQSPASFTATIWCGFRGSNTRFTWPSSVTSNWFDIPVPILVT